MEASVLKLCLTDVFICADAATDPFDIATVLCPKRIGSRESKVSNFSLFHAQTMTEDRVSQRHSLIYHLIS